MKPQLTIFHDIISVGSNYRCSKSWVNETGYKWKVGEMIIVSKIGVYSVLVRLPQEKQHFDMRMEIFTENFEQV